MGDGHEGVELSQEVGRAVSTWWVDREHNPKHKTHNFLTTHPTGELTTASSPPTSATGVLWSAEGAVLVFSASSVVPFT